MSTSCVATCTHCGAQRFWLSDTLSLQTDDGRLRCLPHPGEEWVARERYGLTVGQASKRGRLYRETFYVCKNCGREGEIIAGHFELDSLPALVPIGCAMKWCWGAAAVIVLLAIWMRWQWDEVAMIGGFLLIIPGAVWWANRKTAKELAAVGLPRADAPGRFPIPKPTAGFDDKRVVGRVIGRDVHRWPRATGPCCDNPEWLPASNVSDEDRVPCRACEHGVMVTSQHAIS